MGTLADAMTGQTQLVDDPRLGVARRSLAGLGAALGALVLGTALALGLYRYPLPAASLAAGAALLALLALAIARYEAAIALGFLLFGVVKVEPAPPDVVFGVVIAVAAVTGRLRLDRAPRSAAVLLALFLGLNLVASVEVVDAARAASFFLVTLYLAVFALWLTGYVDSARRARTAVGAYVVAATASALLGVLALFVPFPGDELLTRDGARVEALFKDPNVFGPFLVPAALILLEEILAPRLFPRGRVLAVAALPVVAAGILFSYSRAAWLNTAVGLLVMLAVLALRRGGARKVAAIVAAGALAAGILVVAVALSGSGEFLAARVGLQEYDANRFAAQLAGLPAAERYPFGVGPGQYEQIAPISAHSTYVRAVAEEGVLGLLTLLALLTLTLGWAIRNAIAGRDSYGVGSAALLGAWCGILVNGFVVDTLHWRHLWLVAALVWVGSRRPRRRGL